MSWLSFGAPAADSGPAVSRHEVAVGTVASQRDNVDLIHFLLGMDFVVEGAITGDPSIDANTVVIPLNVHNVIVGSIADSLILLNTLANAWPHNAIKPGAHVIAYGMRDVVSGSPYSGSLLGSSDFGVGETSGLKA